MKKLFLFISLSVFFQTIYSQTKFKFGDVRAKDLEMTKYENDSSASAVVLHEVCDVFYNYNNTYNDFEIVTEYVVRIKILTSEGTGYSNITIPFYEGDNNASRERITDLTGFTHNFENGKVVKTKLSKDYIFTEDVTERNKRIKLAMPKVQAGSVIEYKYKKYSPFYFSPENYTFQRNIPVQFSHFEIKIPEYFIFNREVKGYERIESKIEKDNQILMLSGGTLNCSAEKIIAEVKNLPALKDEEFVWNYNDFMTGISFELKKIEISGVYYKDYTQTWNNVSKQLNESENFGKQLNHKGLFKDKLPEIMSSQEDNDLKKIRKILNMVRNEVKWNEKAVLYAGNPRKALKEKIGTSGEINALLICVLREAGFTAYPVAMSLRSRGRIPMTYPTLSNLNYFIAGVSIDGKNYYLDGTLPYTDINVIPIDCLVETGLSIGQAGFEWVNLTNIGKNTNIINISANFNEDGKLTGNCVKVLSGESAFQFKSSLKKYKDQEDYLEKLSQDNDIQIFDYEVKDKSDPIFTCIESYKFTVSNISLGDDVLSFNPLLFTKTKTNQFKPETRKLPIEFLFPYDTRININITVPKNYAIEEIPESVKFVYEEGISDFSYITRAEEGVIQISFRLKMNGCIVPALHYEGLREFWSKLFAKNNEFVTLKKIQQ